MPDIVGIRFKRCGKIYHFEVDGSDGLNVLKGNTVVVESSFGLTIGNVVTDVTNVDQYDKELKKVLRITTEEDFKLKVENDELEQEAKRFCHERILARGLPMKLVNTEVTLDRKRIVFYFTAEGRIDFRELVKDLASRFKTRIEMRQIGVRDETKFIGGLGICGREVCCRTFLSNFAPISIRMAKRQDLVLNPGKLSGLCGRLMCCLGFEVDEGPAEDVVELTEDSPILEELEAEDEYLPFERLAESIEAKQRQQQYDYKAIISTTSTEDAVTSQEYSSCDLCKADSQAENDKSDSGQKRDGKRSSHRRKRSHKKPAALSEGGQGGKKKTEGENAAIIVPPAASTTQPSDKQGEDGKTTDTPKEAGKSKKKWRPKRNKGKKKT
ncbi:MAG: stage 0 sporulation family protein [Nitrospirae bacterium]|nr:stage 0 sporulation family protein [Nitrospirota bacterium]